MSDIVICVEIESASESVYRNPRGYISGESCMLWTMCWCKEIFNYEKNAFQKNASHLLRELEAGEWLIS